MADITEEEIQRRRSEGEVITLRVATDPGDLNNYVDDRGVIIGQPVGYRNNNRGQRRKHCESR